MAIKKLTIEEFLALAKEFPVLDVRSPGEYNHAHIPGAYSLPLFTDEERKVVGTTYKQKSREDALELGLRYVGPKMAEFVQTARQIAPSRRVAVHCWRGGQRSASMAWLLRQAGMDVVVLEGGYKRYRKYVLEYLEVQQWQLLVLGGRTGSGKTKILHTLHQMGEQIIDLHGKFEALFPRVKRFEIDNSDF